MRKDKNVRAYTVFVLGVLALAATSVTAFADGDLPPTSLYVQDGLIGHLDAIENGGAGVHETAPTTWTDLTGNQTFTLVNGAAFSSDAWVGNSNRYITASSPKALSRRCRLRRSRSRWW